METTIMLRDQFANGLKTAMKAGDKRRTSTLRLILAAINDRDIANRGLAKEPVVDEEILAILGKMVRQREESAKAFEEGGRIELAQQEREEIEIIRDFLPKQMSESEVREACRNIIAELGASGLRDMGKCMNALKERYPGAMDFSKASGIVKEMLQ
ncbi:aspartyl-tRNA amidotransferase subunit B [Tianweitania populi]|uniref:Aspartyl-tRNA amidotransferase subunit B n=1 Tax=Tianweitania populi TaxID=1607949 RepID=A0A8J3DXY9_9HYPH|nr:aspartyl-tRNA amidotransferase subunit B [Tianweitania populi]